MQVSEVLRVKGNTLFTISPETLLSDCIIVMSEHDIGSLVVIDKGQLVGMLTFKEILKQLSGMVKTSTPIGLDLLAKHIMNPQSLVVAPGTDVNQLIQMMLDTHQRYVPVFDGAMLMGVVSFHDLAKAVAEERGFENQMLKAYIRDWPAEG